MAGTTTKQLVRLLHLSDLHFSADDAWNAGPVLNALAEFIGEQVKGGLVPDLVVITGDLANGGRPRTMSVPANG